MASFVEISSNLNQLAAAMRRYAQLSDKTESETVVKQTGKLAYNIRAGLRTVAPQKGSIRAEVLSGLSSGRGIRIRPAVLLDVLARRQATTSVATGETWYAMRRGATGRGKIVGFQAGGLFRLQSGKLGNIYALAAEREIALRESARGFLSYSSSFKPLDSSTIQASEQDIASRYGFNLSQLIIHAEANRSDKFSQFTWMPPRSGYETAVEGLSKDRQLGILNSAIKETAEDIMAYLRRKLAENAAQVGLN
jgi:hypothetical protein